MSQLDPTLLQPSLHEHDDVVGFNRPWNPHTIIIWGFFGGIICAGALYALNFRRLGWPRRFWPTLIGALFLATSVYFIFQWGAIQGWFAELPRGTLRQVNRAVAIVGSVVLSSLQQRRYRLAVISDTPLGSLWVPGFTCGALGIVAELGIVMAMLWLFPLR